MDRSQAAIAAVFGSLTGSEGAACRSKHYSPASPLLAPNRTRVAANAQVSRSSSSQFARAVAKNIPGVLSALGVSARPRQFVTRRPTAGQRSRRPQCAQNHRFAGRRQVEKESRLSAAGRVRTVAASYWRYHDLLTTGWEPTNAITVPWPRPSTSSLDRCALVEVGENRWHQAPCHRLGC